MKLASLCAFLPIVLLFVACDDESETTPPPPTTGTPTGTTTTGSGGSGGTGGGGGGTAGSAGFDLQNGTWELTNASNTADTISHDGALAITAGGDVWIAFAEPDAIEDSDQDIFTTVRTGADFSTATALTTDVAVQNAFPSMVADGEQLHLVWNGYPDGDNDIFYAAYDGSWSGRVDLTTPTETTPWEDYAPDVALTPAGDLVLVYLAHDTSGLAEVRVLRVSSGAPTGDPVTIIPAGSDGCWSAKIAADSSGHMHVVAECGPFLEESIHYATNRSGTWASEVLAAGGTSAEHTMPDIAIGPDGSSVHVVWQNWFACSNGTCADVYYVKSEGSTFGTPVAVTSTADDTEAGPRLAVDGLGRPLVMFARSNGDGYFDIFVTNSADGTSFGPEVNVTPGTDDSDQWFPYALTFHPQTGLPHLTFTEIVSGTDPLNTEVYHAEFVPGG